MNGVEVLLTAINVSDHVVTTLLNDLTDADLLLRPAPGANHIAWQIGHFLTSEKNMVMEQLPNASYPAFPPGFEEQHSKDAVAKDDGFLTKVEYLELFTKVRGATVAAVTGLSDVDLDKPSTGGMASWFPKVGAILLLAADHPLMHCGQFSVVRRALGKPIAM